MKLLTLLLLVAIVILLGFTLLNWAAFTSPSTLSVGVTTVQVPLGLVMLAASALLTAMFAAFILYQQAAALLAARTAARDLEGQRKLAEDAERSRVAELRSFMETRLATLAPGSSDVTMKRLEAALVARLDEMENALAAHLGEIEDKIDRALAARRVS